MNFLFLTSFFFLVLCCKSWAKVVHPFFEKDGYGYFLQFTDLHVFHDYVEGSDPDIIKEANLGCQVKNETSTKRAGRYGYYNRTDKHAPCESPNLTFHEVFKYLLAIPKLFDINVHAIIFTGDIPNHSNPDGDWQIEQMRIFNKYVAEKLEEYPEMKFFPTVGNHDSWPVNSMGFPGEDYDWLYRNYSEWWGKYLESEEVPDILKFGACYTSTITPGLKLISLNDNLILSCNPYVKNATEEQQHLISNYLESQLKKAEENGEKVVINHHIPYTAHKSSDANCDRIDSSYVDDFLRIAEKYQHVIVANIAGHTHTDFPVVMQNKDGKPILTELVLGSMCSWWIFKTMPAVRVFKFDSKTKEIIDYAQIYNDIEVANQKMDMFNNWEVLYTALKDYELDDFSVESWEKVLGTLFERDDLWKKFENHHMANFWPWEWCMGDCKKELICTMQYLDQTLFDKCYKGEIE